MPNPGETKLYEELLDLLAEEQRPPKRAAAGVERREYRRRRIRDLMSQFDSTGGAERVKDGSDRE